MLARERVGIVLFIVVFVTTLFALAKCARADDYDYSSIASLATSWVGAEQALVVEAACFEIGEEENIDPWVIALVWRFEHGFKTSRGKGYYTGPMQLSPHHLSHMHEYGFDKTSWKDQIRYAARLWRLSADKGCSLYQALQPWGVRGKVKRYYKRIRGSLEHWDSFKDSVTVQGGG